MTYQAPYATRAKTAIAHGLAAMETTRQAGGDPAAVKAAYAAAIDQHLPPAPSRDDGAHCRLRGCMCTHTTPCDTGWVDVPPMVRNAHPYARVMPCPSCRPAAHERYVARVFTR